MPANSTSHKCHWHADFRQTETIPNISLTKWLQAVGLLIIGLLAIATLVAINNVGTWIYQSREISHAETALAQHTPAYNKVLQLSKSFQNTNSWISTIHKGYSPNMEFSPILALLARLKPKPVEFVAVTFTIPHNTDPTDTTSQPNTPTKTVPQIGLLKLNAIVKTEKGTNALNVVEELKKTVNDLSLPPNTKWQSIQTIDLSRQSIPTPDQTQQEIINFTIEAKFSLANLQ